MWWFKYVPTWIRTYVWHTFMIHTKRKKEPKKKITICDHHAEKSHQMYVCTACTEWKIMYYTTEKQLCLLQSSFTVNPNWYDKCHICLSKLKVYPFPRSQYTMNQSSGTAKTPNGILMINNCHFSSTWNKWNWCSESLGLLANDIV